MTIYALLPFTAFIANIVLGIYILQTNPRAKLNQLYGFCTFAWAAWALGDFLVLVSSGTGEAFHFGRLASIGACFTATATLHFFLVFSRRGFARKIYYGLLYLPSLVFIVLNYTTNLITEDAVVSWWGYSLTRGWLFYPYSFFILGYVAAGIIICYRFYRSTAGVSEKIQAKFIMTAIAIPLIGGVATQIIPAKLGWEIMPLTSSLTLFSVIIIARAMMKYGLLAITPELAIENIISVMADSVIAVNTEMRIEFVNQAALDILGYKKEDLAGRPFSILCPESKLATEDGWRKLKEKSSIKNVDMIFLSKDRRKIPFNVNASVLKWRGRDFVGIAFVAKDMREIKGIINDLRDKTKDLENAKVELEAWLKELEKHRTATLNILEDAHESHEKLEKANKALERRSAELTALNNLNDELIGVSEVEEAIKIINKRLAEILKFSTATFIIINPFEDGEILYLSYLNESVDERFIDGTKKHLLNFLSGNKDGSIVKMLKVLEILKPKLLGSRLNSKSAAKLNANVCFPLNIGERKLGAICLASDKEDFYSDQARGAVEQMVFSFSLSIDRLLTLIVSQHSKTVSLVESLSDGVIMLNDNRELVLLNPKFTEYTGLSQHGFSLAGLDRLLANIKIKDMIDQAFARGTIVRVKEVKIYKYFFQIFITPVKDNKKKIVGCAVILHDITHLKELDRAKSEFVSVASHQLRTPLTAIKLFTEMLMQGDVGKLSNGQKDYLNNIFQSTERMARLVNDLLNISRIESGRLRSDPQPVRLGDLIRSVLNESKPLADLKRVSVKFIKGKEELPKVAIDKSLFRQVVHNLVVNAIRYSLPDKGKVEVGLERRGSKEYLISVKDNGIGIPKKDHGKIFEKFFRSDNAIKTETEGTGLGLYVSKMIVESSGGKIWFESKKGKGTAFFVSMPLAGMKSRKGERGLMIS